MDKPRQYVILAVADDKAQMFYRTKRGAALKPVKHDLKKPHREAEIEAIWEAYVKAGEPFMYYHEMRGYPAGDYPT